MDIGDYLRIGLILVLFILGTTSIGYITGYNQAQRDFVQSNKDFAQEANKLFFLLDGKVYGRR